MKVPVKEMLVTYNPAMDVLCNVANLKLLVEDRGAEIGELSIFITENVLANPFDSSYLDVVNYIDRFLGIQVKNYEVMDVLDLKDIVIAKSLKRIITAAPNAVLLSDDLANLCNIQSEYRFTPPLFPQETIMAEFKNKEPLVFKAGDLEWTVTIEETPSRLPNSMRGFELKLAGPNDTDEVKGTIFDEAEKIVRSTMKDSVHVVFSRTDNTQ